MADQLEELIKEIAVKHGISVSRDDPILVLQTINNRLMSDSSKAQEVMLQEYKQEFEALALRWSSDSKEKAERILNLALSASKDAMAEIMREGGKSIVKDIKCEIDAALLSVASPVQDAHRLAILNVFAACITLAAAGVALWATFH